MAFKLGAKSLAELEGVHPSLVAVVKRAIELTTQDFTVFDGLRTIEEQKEHVRKGNSQTMNSKHLDPDGSGPKPGRAVDLVPYINGGPRWEPVSAFDAIGVAMKRASKELGVPVEWGAEWRTFVDRPHWQLPDGWEPKGGPQPAPKPNPAPAPPDKPLRPIPEAETITHRDVKKTGKQGGLIVIVTAIVGAFAFLLSKIFGAH